MKALYAIVLSCLLASPAYCEQPKFDAFLHSFRLLYRDYHMGKPLPVSDVNRIAMRIWNGSGHNWENASITACQGICESHYQLSTNSSFKYRGHVGMHSNTIIAEGLRIGIIKHSKHDVKWLLQTCRKDPSYADFLSASRLGFLIEHYGSARIAIFQYVTGYGWKKKPKDAKRSIKYWMTVQRLKNKYFKEN